MGQFWKNLDTGDRITIASTFASLAIWFVLKGKHKVP